MYLVLLLLVSSTVIYCDLPQELDPFLEKLFEFEECEEFVSNADFVSVSTTECSPFFCDFPRELCQRPANKFRDASANQCKSIPTKCITAANGGVPLPSATTTTVIQITMGPINKPMKSINEKPSKVEVNVDELCKMEAPIGRFCGFVRKWTYNRDTGRCDQFWFPGCKTRETNANLFDTHGVCEELALLCRERLRPPSTTSLPLFTTSPFSPITLPPLITRQPSRPFIPPRVVPPPPPPRELPISSGGGDIFGQQNGNGEFGNNIVSLIANGLMGSGGNGRGGGPSQSSNNNAAQAFNVLSQFTNFDLGNLPSLLG